MPSAKKFYVYILCGLFILCAAAVAGTKWYSAAIPTSGARDGCRAG